MRWVALVNFTKAVVSRLLDFVPPLFLCQLDMPYQLFSICERYQNCVLHAFIHKMLWLINENQLHLGITYQRLFATRIASQVQGVHLPYFPPSRGLQKILWRLAVLLIPVRD